MMINGDYTIPPYQVGDLFAPYGSVSWRGMVVSMKDAHHGSAVSIELMDDDFTDYSKSITERFEEYHIHYNKSGRKLSNEEVERLVASNEADMRLFAYSNGEGKFLLPTIDELKSFFKNVNRYYDLRRQFCPYKDSFDIERNYNCQCFLSRTLNANATEVYVYDVKKKEAYTMPIDRNLGLVGFGSINAIYVLEFEDTGRRVINSRGEVETKYQDKSGGCYIATAVYGSYDCPEVWTLRRYRDDVLDNTWYGRLFIRTYYAISPTLVKWFGTTGWFRKLFFTPLNSWVKKLNEQGFENKPYIDKGNSK